MNKTFLILTLTLSMGLFSNCGNASVKTNAEYRGEWDFYFCNVDGILSSLYVDLGLRRVAPLADKPYLIGISIKMSDPMEDGLSSQAESEILFKIEDALADLLSSAHKSVYAGRLTSDGYRKLYFYSGTPDSCGKIISDVMAGFPEYSYDLDVKEDKKWSGYYDFLYPLPQQYQSILNRRVIDQLVESGDDLTKEREVFHWIYFKTARDRKKFLKKIAGDNFTVTGEGYEKSPGKLGRPLVIKRVDKVDYASVDEYSLYLWNLANETNGEYDGWETSVEK